MTFNAKISFSDAMNIYSICAQQFFFVVIQNRCYEQVLTSAAHSVSALIQQISWHTLDANSPPFSSIFSVSAINRTIDEAPFMSPNFFARTAL